MNGNPNFPYTAPVYDDGMNNFQEDDLTASYETIRPSGQQGNSFNDIFNEDYVWHAGESNPMTESGESSNPTTFYTGTTSNTSGIPEDQIGLSHMLFQHNRPVPRDHLTGDQFRLVGSGFPADLPQAQYPVLNLHEDFTHDTKGDEPLSPAEQHHDSQSTSSPRNIGRPDHNLQALSQHVLLQKLHVVGNTFQAQLPGPSGRPSYESLLKLQEGLSLLSQNVETEIQQHESGPKVPKPPSTTAATPANQKRYQCNVRGCKAKELKTIFPPTTFARHIESMHYPRYTYFCTREKCPHIEVRRDKIIDHCNHKHLLKPNKSEINRKRKERPCPFICPICSTITRKWPEFYKCIMKHYLIARDTLNNETTLPDRDDEGDNIAGTAPDSDSPFPDPGLGGVREISRPQSQRGYNSGQRQRSSAVLNQNLNQTNGNSIAPEMTRTFSGTTDTSQLHPNDLQGLQGQRRRSDSYLYPDMRRNQPSVPPRQQPRQAEMGPQEPPSCQICGHVFSQACCNRRDPREGCHECADASRMLAVSSLIPQGPPSNQRGLFNAVAPRFQPHGIFDPRMNDQFRNIMYQQQQQQHPRPSGGRDGSFQGSYGGPYNVLMMTSIEDPEENMVNLLDSKTVDSQFGGTWLGCLPIRVPMPSGMVKMRKNINSVGYNGPLVYNDPATLPQIDLPFATSQENQCRCPCRLKALKQSYSSKARVELTPGKLLDVNMKILPEDRVGHPLRTRIRVVVKLLKLRSSVARSGNKRKTAEDAKAIEKALKTSLDVSETDPSSSSGSGSASSSIKNIEQYNEDIDEPYCSDSDSDSTCSDTESVTSSVSATSSVSEYSIEAESKPNSPYISGAPFPDESNLDNDDLPPSSFDESNNKDITPHKRKGCDHPFFTDDTDDTEDLDGKEIELEINLDLDLQTCLNRLSVWTDGLADIKYSLPSQKITDPTRIFEYFFKYILYVILALSRSRKHGSPSLLE